MAERLAKGEEDRMVGRTRSYMINGQKVIHTCLINAEESNRALRALEEWTAPRTEVARLDVINSGWYTYTPLDGGRRHEGSY